MTNRNLVDEAWQLYIKILNVERASAFSHIGLFNRDSDDHYKLTNKAYCRYKRRRNVLESSGSDLVGLFPNQRLQSFTSVNSLSLTLSVQALQ